MIEAWKPVVGYEGLYEVSDMGHVKSSLTGRMLKQCNHSHGYLQLSIRKNGKQKTYRTHTLVLTAFVTKPDGHIVNHKDGNKKNNNLSNLEWVTYGGNLKHAMDSGLQILHGEYNAAHKLTAEDVKEIRASVGVTREFLAEKYGVCSSTLGRAMSGKTWRNVK